MSDKRSGPASLAESPAKTGAAVSGGDPARRRRGRARRIAVQAATALFALAVLAVVGMYAALNHLESSIRRIPVTLAASAAAQGSPRMTVLITSSGLPQGNRNHRSGLIMLLHLNADGRTGGVVSIPPTAWVRIPGHGTKLIENATLYGGASLLVRTVHQVTGVPIDHFASIDFGHVEALVNALGGVDVTLPRATTSFGLTFSAGVNHLDGIAALDYVRQPSLTEQGRVLRQQILLRAVINKIVSAHMLANPVTTIRVLGAFTSMLTVDSNFTNSELTSLAASLRNLSHNNGTFVTAPVRASGGHLVLAAVSRQLWTAIRNDSIAGFARQYSQAVTPATAP
jgi:LCP family protein required for cell wall assembly